MLYAQAKLIKAAAEEVEREACKVLLAIPGINSGSGGMTPDAVRNTPEYQTARLNHARAFENMRNTNQWFLKHFKNEANAERLAKHAA